MQQALVTADANLPASGFYRMNDLLDRTLAMQRVEVGLLSALAALALLLSTVGIFGLVANMVAQRTREIGIRMALGSTAIQAMMEIGHSGAAASAFGIISGLILSFGALRVMRSVIYGVGLYDVTTLTVVVLVLVIVTIFGTFLPVLRITRIDPARTLREE